MAGKPKTIDEYLAALSDDKPSTLVRATLLRKLVKARIAENSGRCTNR
jgi:hypothetical protein